MPELPDVEVFRRRVAHSSLHRDIERVRVHDGTVLRGISARSLRQRLRGRQLETTSRRGKQLFVLASGGGALVLHFGMTGLVATGAIDDDQPEHCRRERLGPDALAVTTSDLQRICEGSRRGVKALLMEQATLAGIGNIYSDEICFQARIDPRRRTSDLAAGDVRGLHRQLRRVLDLAIDRHAAPAHFPRTWLIHRREDGARCPRGDGRVRRFSAGGRSAYLCPACQR